jgi:uncharacterized membrane protein
MTLTTISGLPAHVLLVHALVVLVPLTSLLEVLCAVWPAARRHLVWLVLALAAVTTLLTPITANAGEWFYDQQQGHRAILNTHATLGSAMTYYSIALLAVAIVLSVVHRREVRAVTPGRVVSVAVAVLAIAVSVAATVQIVRVGDSGARAVWSSE